MIDFLTPAPVTLPENVPPFYTGNVNLSLFRLKYNKASLQEKESTNN